MMTESLFQALALAPGPQTAAELCDALRRQGRKTEEFEVLKELRRLQNAGSVRLEGTRWRLLKMPANIKITPAQRNPSPLSSAGGAAAMDEPTNAIISPTVLSPPAPAGRWALFRRLCRYYMDCLLQDEAPQLRAYVENEDDTWIAVQQIPWTRLVAGGGFAVSLAREQAPFQRNRVRRGEEECVYIGYPLILVTPKDTSGFVVPLFAQPMQADWSAGVLHLKPDGPIAVNGAWLEYRFRQRAEREAFLRAMGFLNDVTDDDDEERTAPGPKDFARLAQDAAHYLHDPDRHAEHIRPLELSHVVDWKKCQPGLYNAAMLTLGPRLRYTRSLLRDLRAISEQFSDEDLDMTALAQLFPHEPMSAPDEKQPPGVSLFFKPLVRKNVPAADGLAASNENAPNSALQNPPSLPTFAPDHLAQTRLLHPSQRAAVVNAISEPVSLVTGPPGTGKSEVVATILLNQLLREQPTLFASKNHQALDAVLPRLNSAAENGDLIIQSSSRDLAQRQNYLAKLQTLLARPPRHDASQGESFLRQFSETFARQRTALADINALEQAREDYGTLNEQLQESKQRLPSTVQSDEAILSWPSAVTRERLETLETDLRRALRSPKGLVGRIWHALRRKQFEAHRRAVRDPLIELPNPFLDRAIPGVEAPVEAWNEFFAIWKTWVLAAQVSGRVSDCEQRIAQMPRAEDCNQRLADAQQFIEQTTREWMTWAAGGLPNPLEPSEREVLANLRAGIQTWGPERFKRELREHFPLILSAFPLWSVSNLSARGALPLVPGLFDLVVVDEASQCDIASVVPLLARSRRAIFAGDPMQLRHISTLDVAVEQTLLQQYDLTNAAVQRFTYRVNSAFELADSNSTVPNTSRVRLDLHFRSHNLIADYCNESFYANTLHVVTVTDKLKIPHGSQPGIHWTHVAGKLEPGPTGAWCADEIEAIRRELLSLAAGNYPGTIGVVTPFRQQMIRLKDTLDTSDELPREFVERVHLLAATAHGFQGDERDLIIFSLCGGPGLPDGSRIFLRENPNLFNVAVSRAKAVLHVVGNRDWALTCGVPFIEKLARRTLPGARDAVRPQRAHYQSPWEKVLAEALQEAGVTVIPQYPIAGRFLDLGILNPKKIDVEVDGESVHRTAGGGRKDDDHWRDLQLRSLGWRVCRFWVYELREDLPRCVQRVMKLLEG